MTVSRIDPSLYFCGQVEGHAMHNWTVILKDVLGDMLLALRLPDLRVPTLPQAVTRFLQLSADEDAELDELAQILETDSGLTVGILKAVNSSSSALRSKAKNVGQALALLGRHQSRLVVTMVGTEGVIRARRSRLINANSFWHACLQKALFAREMALFFKIDPQAAFVGGLLQDFLLPILTDELYSTYLDFVESHDSPRELLPEFERHRLGWDHALAGALIGYEWHLPHEVVCCILYHHRGLAILADPKLGRTSVAAVALSALLPDALRQHPEGLDQLRHVERII